MKDKFEWKAEIKFDGTADEFNDVLAALDELPFEVEIPEWEGLPHHFAGCMPIPIDVLIGVDNLEKLVADLPRIRIKYIRDIYGGMRTAHVHVGDEVVLLDRARFRTLVADVAHELGERRAEMIEDYVGVMGPVGGLDPTRQPG